MSGLANLKFPEGNSESNFIKFETGKPVKLRVLTNNPTIHVNKFGKEQYSFAVWNHDEGKAMILSKGASIARGLHNIDIDDDFGADITKVDVKIMPSGDGMNREYSLNVLPKATDLTKEQIEKVNELDGKLDEIFKGSVRATAFNEGKKPETPPIDEEAQIDDDLLNSIPF